MMEFLQIKKGACDKCGEYFTKNETVQETNVECSKCKKQFTVCKHCKHKGCDCGGIFLNTFDNYPEILH
jgi:hypothetical protein